MKEIQKFMDEHLEWAVKTFGKTPPAAPLHHLLKEIEKELIPELSPSPKDDRLFDKAHFEHVKEEFADCFILFFHAVKKYDITAEELFEAVQAKFVKNKKRKWGPVDENGVSLHIKEDGKEI
jgi:NTP pyrophosphatase (non-canonical NTP hydrolase)